MPEPADDRPPLRVPPAKDADLPWWINKLLEHYNESWDARRCYTLAATAHRFHQRHHRWPTRRELVQRCRHAIFTSNEFADTLENLELLGHPHYIFKRYNQRGRPTVYIGFDLTLEMIGTLPDGVEYNRGLRSDQRHDPAYRAEAEEWWRKMSS
jgi:hypothetical protein